MLMLVARFGCVTSLGFPLPGCITGNLTAAHLGQTNLFNAPALTVGLVNARMVSSVRKSQWMPGGPQLSDTYLQATARRAKDPPASSESWLAPQDDMIAFLELSWRDEGFFQVTTCCLKPRPTKNTEWPPWWHLNTTRREKGSGS